MSASPVNLFSQHCRPDEALAKLQGLLPDGGVVTYGDGHWAQITGKWKRGWLKSALTLIVTHSPAYYAGAEWPIQVRGMNNYLGKFTGSEKRSDLPGYIMGLSFALSFLAESDFVDDDPRLEVIFEMASFLDGVVFLPTCLLDSSGKTIVSADGESDPDAKLPDHTPVAVEAEEMGEVDEDHEGSVEPPALEQAVARFGLMVALVERGFLEQGPVKKGEVERLRILEDLKRADIWTEAEEWESRALEAPVGRLDDKIQWKLPWLSEGAVVLAWALRLSDLPPYDEQVDVQILYQIRDKVMASRRECELRSLEEMETLSKRMLAIHWRLRQFYIKKEAMDFAEYAPRAWWGAMDLGLARLIDNDLEINGRALASAPEESWRCASGIMEERRTAVLWLLGASDRYSEVDTST